LATLCLSPKIFFGNFARIWNPNVWGCWDKWLTQGLEAQWVIAVWGEWGEVVKWGHGRFPFLWNSTRRQLDHGWRTGRRPGCHPSIFSMLQMRKLSPGKKKISPTHTVGGPGCDHHTGVPCLPHATSCLVLAPAASAEMSYHGRAAWAYWDSGFSTVVPIRSLLGSRKHQLTIRPRSSPKNKDHPQTDKATPVPRNDWPASEQSFTNDNPGPTWLLPLPRQKIGSQLPNCHACWKDPKT
jgi:hypothetical protein